MFRLSIVTPEKIVYEGQVKSLVVPGSEGYLGVLSNHAPLISALRAGKIEFTDSTDRSSTLAVSAGFFEVSNNFATVLADEIEAADDIDIEAAREALKSKRQALRDTEDRHESERLKDEIAWHRTRVKVFEDTH